MSRRCLLLGRRVAYRFGARFGFVAYVSNEKSNTVSASTPTMDGGKDHQGRPAAARHRISRGTASSSSSRRRQRHHPDGRRQDDGDRRQPALRPRPRTLRPGCRRQERSMSNENDNTVTVIDIEKRVRSGDIQVGVEPRAWRISPDGKILINTSETTNMAHFIDPRRARSSLTCWSTRGRASPNSARRLRVMGVLGDRRHVSIIDPAKRVVTGKIDFSIPGLAAKRSSRSASASKDGKTAFVALGPANRIAVIDATSHG